MPRSPAPKSGALRLRVAAGAVARRHPSRWLARGIVESVCLCRIADAGEWAIAAALSAELVASVAAAVMGIRTLGHSKDDHRHRIHVCIRAEAPFRTRCRTCRRNVWILVWVRLLAWVSGWRGADLVAGNIVGPASGSSCMARAFHRIGFAG